jgi:hypothetical protein
MTWLTAIVDMLKRAAVSHDIRIDGPGVDLRDLPQASRHVSSGFRKTVECIAIDTNRHRRLNAALQHDDPSFDWL